MSSISVSLAPSNAPTTSTSSISGMIYGFLIFLFWVAASGLIFYLIYTMPSDEDTEELPIVQENKKEVSIEVVKVLHINI